jgi:integrase
MLTDTKVKQARRKAKPYKLADKDGLYLYVSPSGAKSWRYDYRIGGLRETLTIGQYPDIPLAGEGGAREQLEQARRLVAQGKSPARQKKAEKASERFAAANSVKALGEAWYAGLEPLRSKSWRENARRWLDKDIYPAMGSTPIANVTHGDVSTLTRRIAKARGARSAHSARQLLGNVFEYAQAQGLEVVNHARAAAKAVALPEPKGRAPLGQKEIPAFVEAVDAYRGRLPTKLAIKLLLLTFVRKSELLNATWDEIDFQHTEWRIPAERMKMKDPHIVPLSKQAVVALKELSKLASGSRYLLPSIDSLRKPLSDSTLNVAFDRMGYGGRFTPHGLRATASTILNEQGFRPDVIERQLAHTERNRIRAAYNKAEYLEERRAMMQHWANFIDALCAGENVIGFRRAAA